MSDARERILCAGTLAVILGQAACMSSDAGVSTTIAMDSAGVVVVDNVAIDLEALPRRELGDLELDIGMVEGDEAYQLFRVRAARRLEDESVLILNGGSHEVRRYGPDGRLINRFGTEGDGPGEFRFPIGLWPVDGDSVAIWDSRLSRLAVFAYDGGIGRIARPGENPANVDMIGVLSDGSFVVVDLQLTASTEFTTMYQTYVRYDRFGALLDTLPRQPFSRMGPLAQPGMMAVELFGARTTAMAHGESYWVGTGREAEVREYSSSGELLRIVRWSTGERQIPQKEIDRHWDERLRDLEGEQLQRVRDIRDAQPVAQQFPAYSWFVVTDAGGLWVRRYDRPSEEDGPARWLEFEADGSLVAEIVLGAEDRVLHVGRNHVVLLIEDDWEVEHVRVVALPEAGAF